MKLGIIRLYAGESGKVGYYNIQEIGLAKALAKKGIKTDIFFLVDKKKYVNSVINNTDENIRVIYIPATKIANHGIVSPEFILDYKLDLVHLLSDNQIMVPNFINFCKKNNIPVYNYVGTIDSDTKKKYKKFIMDFISKRNLNCFKKSTTIVKTLDIKEKLKVKNVEDVKVIPVGLDLGIIPKIEEDKDSLRKKLNLPLDKKVLLFVGRLEQYKNPKQVIEIFNELLKKSKDYFLVIIGQGSLRNVMDNEINKYGISDHLVIIDKIENSKIHKYYKTADIFLNFNNKEIFGMSILEAMNQGCKVIAVNAPGPNFIIENNINGVLINSFDPKEWISVIERVSNNKEIGKLAKKKIEQKFNWEKISQLYIELYKDILGDKNEET